MKRRMRTKEKRLVVAVFSFFVLLVAASLFFAYEFQGPVVKPLSGPRAAIVDHLSVTAPNQTFVNAATSILENAGYKVDYYPGEKVTVDCYRNLAALGYNIILLRVHAGYSSERQTISFFTSETYSESEHAADQLAGYLHRDFFVYPPQNGEPGYFSITPLFVKDALRGRFNDTTVIMMGCYGLEYPSMAQAFIQKGAKVYVSWNGSVAADHTDEATIALLKHLIVDRQPVGQAVQNTMSEVGVDPTYKSLLTFYPSEAGEQTIPDVKGKS